MHLFQSNVSMGEALGYSVLGMAIVFAVLIVLMLVVKMMERFPPSPRPALPDS